MRTRAAALLMLAALALSACADLPLGKWRDNTIAPPGPRPRPDPAEAH